MGFFSRNDDAQELIAAPVEVIAPRYTGEQLEHMVADTYKDKLQLQAQLKNAKLTIKAQEDVATKLSAAELLAKSLQNENESLKRKVERAEQERDSWRDKAKQAEDAALVNELRKDDVREAVRGEVVDEMLEALIYENGNWSKDRVREFVSRFSAKGQDPEPYIEYEVVAPDSPKSDGEDATEDGEAE